MAKASVVIEKLDYIVKRKTSLHFEGIQLRKRREGHKMKFDKMVLNKMACNKKILG